MCVWPLECEFACECDAVSSVCYDFVCTNDICLIACSVVGGGGGGGGVRVCVCVLVWASYLVHGNLGAFLG